MGNGSPINTLLKTNRIFCIPNAITCYASIETGKDLVLLFSKEERTMVSPPPWAVILETIMIGKESPLKIIPYLENNEQLLIFLQYLFTQRITIEGLESAELLMNIYLPEGTSVVPRQIIGAHLYQSVKEAIHRAKGVHEIYRGFYEYLPTLPECKHFFTRETRRYCINKRGQGLYLPEIRQPLFYPPTQTDMQPVLLARKLALYEDCTINNKIVACKSDIDTATVLFQHLAIGSSSRIVPRKVGGNISFDTTKVPLFVKQVRKHFPCFEEEGLGKHMQHYIRVRRSQISDLIVFPKTTAV